VKPAATDTAPQMQFLLPDLATMLDARQPLYRLARTIDWTQFESAVALDPPPTKGLPNAKAKPPRK